MKKLVNNKLGAELALNTIVIGIIAIIVFVIVVYYFVTNYSGNGDQLIDIGTGAIDGAKNFTG